MDSVVILKKSNKPSTMSTRGIDLIELLLTYSYKKTQRGVGSAPTRHMDRKIRNGMNDPIPLTASTDGIPRLDLKAIAAYLAADKQTSTPANMKVPVRGSSGDNTRDMGYDLGNLDLWLQYFDSSVMP